MQLTREINEEADRFLQEGLHHFVPAVAALNSFIHEIDSRMRKVLQPYDRKLRQLGIASSASRLFFSPTLGAEQPGQVIEVGVRDPDRSGFYLRVDLSENLSESLNVGFWVWTPAAEDRRELIRILPAFWDLDDYKTEVENQAVYVGRYVSYEEYFPGFEAILDQTVVHVVRGLESVGFAERFEPKFRKVQSQATAMNESTQVKG